MENNFKLNWLSAIMTIAFILIIVSIVSYLGGYINSLIDLAEEGKFPHFTDKNRTQIGISDIDNYATVWCQNAIQQANAGVQG